MKIGWLNKIQENLKEQYRLVVLHNATLKEKVSWQFSLYRFFITLILLIIILIGITIALIAFTPLKEYIPGYGGIKHAQKIRLLTQKLDSLEQIYNQYDYYEKNVRTILEGNVSHEDTITIDTTRQVQNLQPALTLSKTDSILLELNITPANKSDKQTPTTKIKPNDQGKSLFFPPIAGIVSSSNLEVKAYVKGSLREIDQFGQKKSFEGNYKIKITVDPTQTGQGQVQKTSIMTTLRRTTATSSAVLGMS